MSQTCTIRELYDHHLDLTVRYIISQTQDFYTSANLDIKELIQRTIEIQTKPRLLRVLERPPAPHHKSFATRFEDAMAVTLPLLPCNTLDQMLEGPLVPTTFSTTRSCCYSMRVLNDPSKPCGIQLECRDEASAIKIAESDLSDYVKWINQDLEQEGKGFMIRLEAALIADREKSVCEEQRRGEVDQQASIEVVNQSDVSFKR